MLRIPKSIAAGLADWIDGVEDDAAKSLWDLREDKAVVSSFDTAIEAWKNRRLFNTWPRAGGWQDQPLRLLLLMNAVEVVVSTKRASINPDFDYSTMTKTQASILEWLNTE